MSAERNNVLERLIGHAENGSGGILLASEPGSRCTELLRTTSERLFSHSDKAIPVFFSMGSADEDAAVSAKRFASSFISQVIAFRRRDVNLAFSGIGLSEITRLSEPLDIDWIERAVERIAQGDDGYEFLERCLSIPLLASQAGVRTFTIFDRLHETLRLDDGKKILGAIERISSSYTFPFVLAGYRRFLSSVARYDRLDLGRLSMFDASVFIERFCSKDCHQIDDASRDLIAIQTMGRPAFIEAIANRVNGLDSFPDIARAYTEELFAGKIGQSFDRLFDSIVPGEIQPKLVSLLADSTETGAKLVPVRSWKKALSMDANEFEKMIENLHVSEIVRVTSNRVQPMADDIALTDYIKLRHRLETVADDRAMVYAASLSESIRRAPRLMAAHYRKKSAIGLRDLLATFDGREMPAPLLDYNAFKERYQGRPADDVVKDLASDNEKLKLPSVAFAAHAEDFYPPIGAAIERERAAVAMGFQNGAYSADDEIYWLACEIDSKLEATADLTEFWCDRLEMIAVACGFRNYRIWLVSPVGFDAEAIEILNQRNAFGSCHVQVNLFRTMLDVEKPPAIAGDEYEIVIPMDGETELVAAHTLEEIAKRHGFKSHDINQIKTALVEACINAAEHSHSPDRRTRLKFTVFPESIKITVANRGLRLTDAAKHAADSSRRGWGLKLIGKLMDEVHIDQTDDGTIISMTKLLA